jgi:sulfur-oxidizing protein SoxX
MNQRIIFTLAAGAIIAAGCASMPSSQELDQQAQAVIKASFRDQGIAKVDRLEQDLGQRACSSDKPPADDVARQVEAAALATIRWPAGGQYLGDWREGEKLAQNGRGMTWTDSSAADNGGNCYNCHQLSKSEISFGTIGPSLYQYGKLRGVTDPASPASAEIVKYTWGKLWNSKAYAACSNMPRFGHAGLLKEQQLRDLMD